MAAFKDWIKRTAQQVWDPGREERIQEIATLLLRDIQKSRNAFSLAGFAKRVECSKQELQLAKSKAYRTYLERAWRDGKVAPDEQKVLDWVVNRLEIPVGEAESEQLRFAQERFVASLAKAMDDGVIDDQEAIRLSEIAGSVKSSLAEFVSQYFRSEGESFLRGVFAACTQDGMLADDAWSRLLETTKRLGIPRESLTAAILPQAKRFIEHVLADAKSDGEFSEGEEKQLLDLIQTLRLSGESWNYFLQTISILRTIRLAGEGKLPVIACPKGVTIRAGEIVHLHERATWFQRRILKNSDCWDQHIGAITVTDNRLLFSSDTKSFDVRFGKVIAHSGSTGVIRLQRAEKPESVIQVSENEPVAYAVLEGAIGLASQTRLAKNGGDRTRHIPRDVRQRVWQKYGGQCAECSDDQYLEFDHVIPVAKGGSNSDANVQLLCRKCNLKKSDFI
jgi:hypothetical protein